MGAASISVKMRSENLNFLHSLIESLQAFLAFKAIHAHYGA